MPTLLPALLPALLLTLLTLLPAALAQDPVEPAPADLLALLGAVDDHPALQAAAASLEAARLRLQGIADPIALRADYGYTGLLYGEPDPALPPLDLPDGRQDISVTATLRPFLFGDLRDAADQRQVDVLRAALTLRDTRAGLEAQAVEAAAALLLTRSALAVAAAGRELAADALAATDTRHRRGAATLAELERARLSLARAEDRVRSAESDLQLAEVSLELLVGPARLERLPDLAPLGGVPPEVERAHLDVLLAEIGLRSAERALVPTVQASYAWNIDADNTLAFSLESRTLQPSIAFQHSSTLGAEPAPAGGPALDATFTIGVGLSIGPEQFRSVDAGRHQLAAAEAALRSVLARAPVTELSLQNALAAAERQLDLAARERELSAAELEDAHTRVELGLATELDALQASLALDQAELALLGARLERLARILDWYSSYAIPLSEVLP